MNMASTQEVLHRKYTVREAAKILYVSKTTVHRMINSGKLPAYRIGNQFRIPMDSLRAVVGEGFFPGDPETKR